jgi:hypothetical protein
MLALHRPAELTVKPLRQSTPKSQFQANFEIRNIKPETRNHPPTRQTELELATRIPESKVASLYIVVLAPRYAEIEIRNKLNKPKFGIRKQVPRQACLERSRKDAKNAKRPLLTVDNRGNGIF